MRRYTGSAATIAALLLVATPSPAAQSPPPGKTVVVVLEDQGVVAPGGTAGVTRLCPKRAPHPVGGTFGPGQGGALAGQFLLAASYPVNVQRAWRVQVKNLTPLPQPFFAGAVCVASPVRFAYPRTTGVAAPGMDAGADLRCPASAPRGIGGFFRPQRRSAFGQIAADSAFRTSAGWDVGVRNLGPQPQPYTAGAVCVGLALRSAVASKVRTVSAGQAVDTTLRCPLRAPQPINGVLAAATAGAAGQILATGAFRTGGRSWDTGIRNVSPDPQAGAAGVVCVR